MGVFNELGNILTAGSSNRKMARETMDSANKTLNLSLDEYRRTITSLKYKVKSFNNNQRTIYYNHFENIRNIIIFYQPVKQKDLNSIKLPDNSLYLRLKSEVDKIKIGNYDFTKEGVVVDEILSNLIGLRTISYFMSKDTLKQSIVDASKILNYNSKVKLLTSYLVRARRLVDLSLKICKKLLESLILLEDKLKFIDPQIIEKENIQFYEELSCSDNRYDLLSDEQQIDFTNARDIAVFISAVFDHTKIIHDNVISAQNTDLLALKKLALELGVSEWKN